MEADLALAHKVNNGDKRAFKTLYDRHVVPLFRFLKQYSKDTAQVEDWVQRAFIKAYNNMGSFQGTSRFSTWLYTIALNEMRTDLRRPNVISFDPAEFQNSRNPENEDMSFEWNDTMKVLLNSLDDAKRTVFLLYEVEGYSHSEIASMLNINDNNSRMLLWRAKQFLQAQWKSMENAK